MEIPVNFQQQNQYHSYIEKEFWDLLREQHFILRRCGYNDILPEFAIDIIRSDPNNIIYHILRALPDIEAIDPNDSSQNFYIDAKSSFSEIAAFPEAFPWAMNILRKEKRTIYIYYDPKENLKKYWFADDPKVISKIDHIIYRKQRLLPPEAINIIQKALNKTVPQPTDKIAPMKSSGDCCAFIFKEDVRNFEDLYDLFGQ